MELSETYQIQGLPEIFDSFDKIKEYLNLTYDGYIEKSQNAFFFNDIIKEMTQNENVHTEYYKLSVERLSTKFRKKYPIPEIEGIRLDLIELLHNHLDFKFKNEFDKFMFMFVRNMKIHNLLSPFIEDSRYNLFYSFIDINGSYPYCHQKSSICQFGLLRFGSKRKCNYDDSQNDDKTDFYDALKEEYIHKYSTHNILEIDKIRYSKKTVIQYIIDHQMVKKSILSLDNYKDCDELRLHKTDGITICIDLTKL